VAYWKFNEGEGTTAYDNTDNNNDGTITGPTWAEGRFGSALSFDGSGGYVSCGTDSSLNPSQITIEAWVQRNVTDTSRDNIVSLYTLGDRQYQLQSQDNELDPMFYWAEGSHSGDQMESITTFQLGTWYHVAASYDGSVGRTYVNGVLEYSKTFNKTLETDGGTFYIGNLDNSAAEVWNGKIDDVRIYNYARTQEQILQDYNQGAAIFFK